LDGLVWGQEDKIVEVAFGAKKLSMSMIIEDDKVSSEDVFEKIQSWEDDVQSVDISTM
jgi:translation elongation factor EF-1beta